MQIIVAGHAGFCFGVKRALDTAVDEVSLRGPVYTLGPLMHNPQEVDRLKNLGILPVESLEEAKTGTVILRSHGVGKAVFDKAEELGLKIIDATCPYVKRVQQSAAALLNEGYQPIIIGDKKHPEVEGILGWTEGKAIVIETQEEAMELPSLAKIGVVVQTTQTNENFETIVDVLKTKTEDIKVINTICKATIERQAKAAELAGQVEVMLVVGGKNSANTKKLASICRTTGAQTYQIEEAGEIDMRWFNRIQRVGITAGASTPDWIIKEVIIKMSELNPEGEVQEVQEIQESEETMAETMASFEDSFINLQNGTRVKGTVVQVTDTEVIVDIGGKSEGVIPVNGLTYAEAEDIKGHFKFGDEIEVIIVRQGDEGHPMLSKRRVDQEKYWDICQEAQKTGQILEGKIIEAVKGGLKADVGVVGFIPASLVDTRFVDDLTQYVNQPVRVKVIECERGFGDRGNKNKLIFSRKAAVIEDQKKSNDSTWDVLEVGQIRKGIVKRITDFGAFVDIGGVDGLLHVSEMAWHRIKHPSEIVKDGDQIEVFVLSADKDTHKVSLSLRKVTANPWDIVATKYAPGTIVSVKVLRLTNFGAFVELEPGVEGLIHISQLSDRRIAKAQDAVTLGQMVDAKIISVDLETKRISLSIRELIEEAGRTIEPALAEESPVEAASVADTPAEVVPVAEVPVEASATVETPVDAIPTEETVESTEE